MTHLETKYRSVIAGNLWQLFGFGFCFFGAFLLGPFAILIGIGIIAYGGHLATGSKLCANCGTAIKNKDLKMCPGCKERIRV